MWTTEDEHRKLVVEYERAMLEPKPLEFDAEYLTMLLDTPVDSDDASAR
jgi:hypothetical protein